MPRPAKNARKPKPSARKKTVADSARIKRTHAARTFNGETFGARLRRLRLDAGASQRVLGEQSDGVSYAYISRLEAGARIASVRAIRELAAALGVTTAYLEFGHEHNGELSALLRRNEKLLADLNAANARAVAAEGLAEEYALALSRYEQGR